MGNNMKKFLYKIRKKTRYKKKQKTIFLFLFAVLACMGFGYAYLTTTLNIEGSSVIDSATWDVHFVQDSVEYLDGSKSFSTEPTVSNHTDLSFGGELTDPGDFLGFEIDVVNEGTINAVLDSVEVSPTLTTEQQKYFKYTITYSDGQIIREGDPLLVDDNRTIKVYFEYIVNEDAGNYPDEDTPFDFDVTMHFIQLTDTVPALVSFDCTTNGGNPCTHYNEYKPNNTVMTLPTNVPDNNLGYQFAGWQNDQGNIVTSVTVGDQNISLTAIYGGSLNINYQKGSNVSGIGKTSDTCVVNNNETSCNVTLPSITANSGYSPDGWYDGENKVGEANQQYVIHQNTTLTARAQDSSKPVCTFITIPSSITYNATSNFVLQCSDQQSGITAPELNSSHFTVDKLEITNISTPTTITNGYQWTITTRATAGTGNGTIVFKENVVEDISNNMNNSVSATTLLSKITPVITLSATSGTIATGKTRTFTVTVKSGSSNARVSGTLNVTSGNASYATVSPNGNTTITNADNSTGVATTETITGVAAGSSTITVKFTPSDTANFKSATNKTYTATVRNAATIPTAANYCKCSGASTCSSSYSSFAYTGASQTIVQEAGTGYTWTAGTTRTNAGSQSVTATLADGYAWTDNTTGTKTITCYIPKATPTITLSASSGTIAEGKTRTFTATVKSGAGSASVSGTLNVTSGTTSVATVSPNGNTTITNADNSTGVAITETVTGVETGSSSITVKFTPTDTANFNSATNKTYTATVKTEATIPTAANYCKCSGASTCSSSYSSFAYTGASQTIVQEAGAGYTWTAGTTRTSAGSQSVTATLSDGYAWSDNSTGTKTITCYIPKATPVITLSASSGTIATGKTRTFTATVKSGASNASVSGTLNVTSGTTSVATVSPNGNTTITDADNSTGVATTETISGVAAGSSTITVKFTPSDTTNYKNASNKTYTATVKTAATIPTAANNCKCTSNTSCSTDFPNFAYTGAAQTITKSAGTGYTFSGNSKTNAGSYTVTATLADGYAWTDNSTGTKTFTCYLPKATPTITLSASSGVIAKGKTRTFTATVKSGASSASVSGTLNVTSGTTSVATVSPNGNTTITDANSSTGVATTETVTGVAVGSSTITVKFTPSDTTNYNNASNKTYTATVKNAATIPTAANNCKCSGESTCSSSYSSFAYTGASQTIVQTAGTGYTWTAGTTRTNAGSQSVTATLSDGYAWTDNSTGTKTITCYIPRATPSITLSASSGTIYYHETASFTATVKSGASSASVSGTLNVTSGTTSVATVSPNGNTTITNANNSTGVATTETITAQAAGSATITVKFTPSDTTNFKNAANKTYAVTAKKDSNCVANKTFTYSYTGAIQTFTAPCKGTYKLEVWGASSNRDYAGFGSYSVGTISLTRSTALYIGVGGQGSRYGGYNGGGNATYPSYSGSTASGGGGATHIAQTTNRGVLANYVNNKGEIIIVAGGGGGSSSSNTDPNYTGGSGGGYIGNRGGGAGSTSNGMYSGYGGTQSAGGSVYSQAEAGSFGKGGAATNTTNLELYFGGGGGGGYYGGGGGGTAESSNPTRAGSGGGGSGYIGNSSLSNKHMIAYCTDSVCSTSTATNTKTIASYSHSSTATADTFKYGNGYAKITLTTID